jgi:aryl-alcohol dehydrogenase-like predicted oxidoreductase
VTLLDTGDFYGMGHNEMLIAEALTDCARDKVLISVKFGAQRDPAGNWIGVDARPSAVKTALAYTLRRLGTDHVDIYRPARGHYVAFQMAEVAIYKSRRQSVPLNRLRLIFALFYLW